MLSERDNKWRAYTFGRPQWIPVWFHVNAACAHGYDAAELDALLRRYPRLVPAAQNPRWSVAQLKPQPFSRADQPYTDPWGCLWETSEDGILGVTTRHPLADWSALDGYAAPDPRWCDGMSPVDWAVMDQHALAARQAGQFVNVSLPHGFHFLRLCDIRGYEAVLLDMMDDDPRLNRLVTMVSDFNAALVEQRLRVKPDMLSLAEDLGAQHGPMISPRLFCQFVKPHYRRLMDMARAAGALVYLHTDGYVLDLVDDLIDAGVQVLNVQDRVNGLDSLARLLKGRVAIALDLDRQHVTRFGSPREVRDLVREAVAKLGDPRGGLSLVYGLYPGIPVANIAALLEALDRCVQPELAFT